MRNIKVLSDREHIYQKTEMYAGGVSEVDSTEYLCTDGGIRKEHVRVVPALLKIINEVIDNAVDVHIKTPYSSAPLVEVSMTDTTISVKDNGCGIPVRKNEDGIYLPHLCWGFARSGGNFDLKENSGLGTFGVGSYITNVLSHTFIGKTCDGTNTYTIEFQDNAARYTESITAAGSRGTVVTFTPDLGRFGLTTISQVYYDLTEQRLMNLKMAFPQLKFKFNGKVIKVNNFKDYCQRFNRAFEVYDGDKFSFAIMTNPDDDFQQFSYVNGLNIKDGGTHIDTITSNIVTRLREKLARKYKDIKPGDIRNKLFVVAFCRDFPNPKFNSQTKEKITNSISDVTRYLNEVDWDAFAQKVARNNGIVEPITEIYKIKEDLKRRQELKSLSKVRKIKNEKYLPPTRKHKYLMIVEGECLDENTEVFTSTFDTMRIKDLQVGDLLLSRGMYDVEVLAITKLLKRVVTVKFGDEDIVCGERHRFYVYNKTSQEFTFKAAADMVPGEDCLVRSKINQTTRGSLVIANDTEAGILKLEDDAVSYTDMDVFTIMRDGVIIKTYGLDIRHGDALVYNLEY